MACINTMYAQLSIHMYAYIRPHRNTYTHAYTHRTWVVAHRLSRPAMLMVLLPPSVADGSTFNARTAAASSFINYQLSVNMLMLSMVRYIR